jgi:hypothetical protein
MEKYWITDIRFETASKFGNDLNSAKNAVHLTISSSLFVGRKRSMRPMRDAFVG